MNLHEYQAKELLERYGIAIPRGRIAGTKEESLRAAERLKVPRYVIKAQVHATERLAEGGVRFAASPDGVAATADAMLRQDYGAKSSTRSEVVRWVLIEEAIPYALQIYAAVVLDASSRSLVLLTSRAGGAGIERRAALEPELIHKTPLSLSDAGPLGEFESAVKQLSLPADAERQAADIFRTMAKMTVELDALQVEINPLALTPQNKLVALDGKLVIDDHALMRHPALLAFRNAVSEDEGHPLEVAADRRHINYAALDGEVGIVVNGAGLALATLDLVCDAGGRPSNFMDIRTTASSLDIAAGVELVLSNPGTKALLVNVHGGGMQRCDTIAEGICVALNRCERQLPIVVRFAGNNAEFARVRLETSGVDFVNAANITDAVSKAVKAANR